MDMVTLTETATNKVGIVFAMWAILLVVHFAVYAYLSQKRQEKLVALKARAEQNRANYQ